MKKFLCVLVALFFIPGLVFAQQTAVPQIYVPIESLGPNADNLQLAISSRDYPVTPGDVYNLTFIMAGRPITNIIMVESDYTINLDALGKIDAKKMTFPALKPIIELIIADAYPRSMPSLTIQTIGSFQVIVTGAVSETQYLRAWGLSRLSDIIRDFLGPSSSIRNIMVRSHDGTEKVYDVLKAQTLGVLEEDPYLRPGDVIILPIVESMVEARGEVLRTGSYQLLGTDTSKELLQYFGGVTSSADANRVRIERRMGNDPVQTFFVSLEEFRNGIPVYNGDIITVGRLVHNQPFVIVEGGILTASDEPEVPILMDEGDSEEDNYEAYYNRVVHPIGIGETLYDVLSDFRDSISDYADLANGYVIRASSSQSIHVNMHELLYSANRDSNILLEPDDRIAIPVRRPFVSVIGAVNAPGRFAYNPSENASYYVSLAGGFDTTRNSREKLKITNQHGNVKNLKQPLEPGDTIYVLSNNFWYNFDNRFGSITTAALFVTSAIGILVLLNNGQ